MFPGSTKRYNDVETDFETVFDFITNASMSAVQQIRDNLARINANMESACRRAGRSTDDVQLVAVTKYARIEWVEALLELGQRHLGESRPQQLIERAQTLPPDIIWHLIGHLQRNKARVLMPHVGYIHSVDSRRLLNRINDLTREFSSAPKLLLEVNVSGEAAKDGFAPDELKAAWNDITQLSGVDIIGLMTMAPKVEHADQARPFFEKLRHLRDELQAVADFEMPELSMGMSGDYQAAILEGSTMIRLGGTLYEGLETIPT